MITQPIIKSIVVIPEHTWWSSRATLSSGTQYKIEQNQFFSTVQSLNIGSLDGEIISYAAFEWHSNFEIITMLQVDIANIQVEKVEIEFYYRKAENPHSIHQIEFIRINSPSTLTASQLWNEINSASTTQVAATLQPKNDDKTLQRVVLGEGVSNAICLAATDALQHEGDLNIAIRKTYNESDTDGYIEIGGKTILNGTENEWREAESHEISFPGKIIITYQDTEKDHIKHEMRYTTSDPTAIQNTPSNSIGGYTASNLVFSEAQIGDYLNSTENFIEISSSSDMPTKTGLIQVGPEIIRFNSINNSDRLLEGAERGIVTLSGFPSSIAPFAEYVHYLDTDVLFNRRPSSGLEQYRCVSVINNSEFEAESVRITLIQNPDSDVQIDIGIEIPRFESKIGITNSEIISGASILTSVSTNVIGKSTGFFDGAHIIIDPGSTAKHAIIESYDDNGVQAEFILDRTLAGFSAGTSFRINPAPSQIIDNEVTRPVENSGRFFGFFSEGGSNLLNFEGMHENQGSLNQYDVFYLWIKRILKSNVKRSLSGGALLIIRFVDHASET